jgi:hypothetical protein
MGDCSIIIRTSEHTLKLLDSMSGPAGSSQEGWKLMSKQPGGALVFGLKTQKPPCPLKIFDRNQPLY